MKKFLVVVGALMVTAGLVYATPAKDDLSIKAGINMGGNLHSVTEAPEYNIKLTSDSSVKDMGFFVGADYSLVKNPAYTLGVGAEFLFEREDFSTLPVYAFGTYKVTKDISLMAKIGYSFTNIKGFEDFDGVEMKNGLTYGFGVEGYVMPDVKMFANYDMYNMGLEASIYDVKVTSDMTYSTLSLGVALNLL